MAESKKTTKTETSESQPRKRAVCPSCFATRFQRHERGQYVDGKFVKDEEVVQCVNCHQVFRLDALDSEVAE